MISRRDLLKLGAATGASLMLVKIGLPQFVARAFSQSKGLLKFAQPLRGVFPIDPTGIPVAVPDGTRVWGAITAQHYTIDVNEYTDKLHPALGRTVLRGYQSRANLGGKVPQRHLGGIIVAQKGTPVQITFQNNLDKNTHPLMVDKTIMGADLGDNRVVAHLHGGAVPWISDGGPFAWFDKDGKYGTSAQSGKMNIYKVVNPKLKPGQAEFYYPNTQSARFMWYHDHAVGITRLNAYAGIASGFIVRDLFEAGLVAQGLPEFIEKGGNEIPLIFQDKIFVGANIAKTDPTWKGRKEAGSLWYPHQYDLTRWDAAPAGGTTFTPPANNSAIPEMFGDTMLVNGVVHPKAGLEPRRYRLRILNACQARFLNLQLYEDNGSGQPDFSKPGPDFLVIGTEGGFLAYPVSIPSNQPMNFLAVTSPEVPTDVDLANPGGSLLTAPGERWDVVIDFAGFGGKKFILYNDAPAPFPGGAVVNDYNSPDPLGLNTRNIMRFDIAAAASSADLTMNITPATPLAADPNSGIDPFLAPLSATVVNGALNLPAGVTVRSLTLNEVFDNYGRLVQMLGTDQPAPLPMGYYIDPANPDNGTNYARAYDDTATEIVAAGSTEIWQIANLTMDTHPMHFHLANVQVLGRRSITDANGNILYANGVPTYTADAKGPEAFELGWKDTVHMNPGEVTTVIMKFDLPVVPFTVPASPRKDMNGNLIGGSEYVWHCHILDHEEHDMMRPLIVK